MKRICRSLVFVHLMYGFGPIASSAVPPSFLVSERELRLEFSRGRGDRRLSFHRANLGPDRWREDCRKKLTDLLGLRPVRAGDVRTLRTTETEGMAVSALVMEVESGLSTPAYLLSPKKPLDGKRAVMAIHGHGTVQGALGTVSDYHHAFAMELARAGFVVLCPELRGFGALQNLSAQKSGTRLDYWTSAHKQFSLVTDGFQHGRPLIGETVEDLLRWEEWLGSRLGIEKVDVAGISYGGDLALLYSAFSRKADRIFASGTLGSFSAIFAVGYNAPAHCIPDILVYMDRSDIAGLSAPRRMALHYGKRDTPSPTNLSASYNSSVPPSFDELRAIYRAFGAENRVSMIVSPGLAHEMDVLRLVEFLKDGADR